MTFRDGLSLLGDLLSRRHLLPVWFKAFLARTLTLVGFVAVFMMVRLWLMQGPPNIFLL